VAASGTTLRCATLMLRIIPGARVIRNPTVACSPHPPVPLSLRERGTKGESRNSGYVDDTLSGCASERVVNRARGRCADGPTQQAYDRARAEFLAAAGYRIVRVRYKDVSREHLETRR